MWCIGIDEAGRGPVIGPLVVGALLIPESDLALLKEIGITDSKLIPLERRLELDSWIRENAEKRGWGFELHVSKPSDIDRALTTTNLNEHEVSIFASLARKLRPENEGGELQVDACDADAGRFGNNIATRLPDWPWEGWSIDSRHAADLHFLAVGAASILAKVARDKAIEEISEEVGIEIGSGYPSDPATISAIPQLISGESPHTCLRWKWATVETAWKNMHGTSVPSRPIDSDAAPTAQRTLF